MRVDKLTAFEQETLNRFLLHCMGLETRGRLMVEFPVIYRKLLDKDVTPLFATAVKDALLDKRRVYEAPDHLVQLAKALGEDGTGLPLAPPGVVGSRALEIALNQIEEDE